MYDVGLADRLRYWLNPAGFQVVEVDGWQSRGRTYAAYDPDGSVNHHTAGALGSDAPSLGICINGRADLPGPLCQVFGSRSLVAYVVAAGVANHAGRGGWNGLTGNQKVAGLELENVGDAREPLYERQADFAARIHCAMITAPGSVSDPANSCQHFSWSTEGKIDFHDWPTADLEARVARLLAAGPGKPPPPPPPAGTLVEARWFWRSSATGGAAEGTFEFGNAGDVPLAGDWDGDGVAGPGVRRGNVFFLAETLGGPTAHQFAYGDSGDHVIVGDWDGDGRDGVGIVRGNVFYLRNTLSTGVAEQVFAYGNAGDEILVGRWKPGATRDSVGVRRGQRLYLRDPDTGVADIVFDYGDPGDRVLMGDWNGSGIDTPAVARGGRFFVRSSNTTGTATSVFAFGNPNDVPLRGRWKADQGRDGLLLAR